MKLLTMWPEKVRLLAALMAVLGLTFLWSNAGWILETTTRLPRTFDGHLKKGIAAFGTGELAEALSAFSTAAQLDDTRAEPRYLRAQVLELMGKTEEAIAEYRAAAALSPIAAPHYNLAVLYRLQKNYDEMETELEAAIHLSPEFTGAHLLLGNLHYDRGDWAKAVAALSEAADRSPVGPADRISLHLMLGTAYFKLGSNRDAEEHWRAVLTLDPQNREALEKLDSRPNR